jgi:Domain of unknown function (DUF5134)
VTRELITSWVLTSVFVATGGYSLLRTATGGTWATRVSHGTHVLMCAAMAAMPWAWAADVPPVPVIVVFTVAGLWHLVVGTVRPDDAGGTSRPGHGRIPDVVHAGMMFAMVWMTVLMAYLGGADPAGSAGMADTPGMQMPGQGMDGQAMTMPSESMPTMSMPTGHSGHMGYPFWARALTVVLGAGFLAAGGWFVAVRARRLRAEDARPHPLELGDSVAGGVMAVAMAASLASLW